MKSRRLARWLWALPLLLLVLVATRLFLGNLREETVVQPLETLRPGVDVELTGVRFNEARSGVRKYRLEAEAATYSARGVSKIQRIRAHFFDHAGVETMQLEANEGDLAAAGEQITLRGAVKLSGTRGFVLKTDHLVYHKADDLLVTDATVELLSQQGRLTGRGLVAHPQQEKFSLLHEVQGELGGPPPSLN